MATLYDLAMQYLNQSLPKTFEYGKTNQPGIPTPVLPVQPTKPVQKVIPRGGGGNQGDGFGVFNADPNLVSNQNYNPRPYNRAMRDPRFGSTVGPNPDLFFEKETGIGGLIKNSLLGRGLTAIGNTLPINRRAIYENELAGEGIMVDNIGRIVSDGGKYNTAENIMAGYGAQVGRDTIDKRRETIKATIARKTAADPTYDPSYLQERLNALDEFERKTGLVLDKTNTIFDDKSLARDPTYKNLDQLVTEGLLEGDDDDDDILDYTNPNIYNTKNIFTQTAPIYTDPDPVVDVQKTKDAIEKAKIRDNKGFDLGVTPGDSGFIGLDKDMDVDIRDFDDYGTYSPGGDGPKNDPIGPSAPDNTPNPGDTDTFNRETGNENDSGSNKIVCTMMNESYGFGSFRNKIWMKFHKDLSPEYQKGYHKLFLPLVRIAKTNKVVKKILEHIAVHSTIDMRQATRGKMHLLGRVYRKILLPLCYIVGKHG